MPHETDDLTMQGILVDAFHVPIPYHHAAIDHDALHAAAGLRVDELTRGAVVGEVGDVIEIDQHQVRLVAGSDRAEAVSKTGGARVADGGVAQDLVRERRARLRIADRDEEAEHLHRMEHALHIRAAAVVASEPQAYARAAHVVDRRNAALELEVAELIEHDAGVGGRQAINLLARDPHAVDNIQPGTEQSTLSM